MSTRWAPRLQVAAACLLVVAYASLSHYCNASRTPGLGAALALVPLSGVILMVAWRATPPGIAVLLSTGLAATLYRLWPWFELNFSLFYLIQESSIYCLLGLTFGRSLRVGRISFCTRLADKLHGPLSAHEVLYTRRVTLAWAVFFFTVAAISVLLYVLAPLDTWSVYINFCVWPLITAMFVVEYRIRQRVLPQVARRGLLATVRVYLASPE